jgi:Spy/CpxP family protein refolding chaperone
MNRQLGSIAVITVLLAGSSLVPALAHDMGRSEGSKAGWRDNGGHFKEALGLTDEQIAKLQAINESRDKALKPLRRKQRDLTIKLKDRLEDKSSDADIKPLLTELRANREAIKAQSKQFRDEKNTVLTPTQQARMMLMKMHRHGGWSNQKHEGFGGDKGRRDGHDGDSKHDEEH